MAPPQKVEFYSQLSIPGSKNHNTAANRGAAVVN